MTEPAIEAEFDTVAVWTERAVRELGPDYAIPAACRGSASSAWLRWVADGLELRPSTSFLDAGAGLGGPAAWAQEQYAVTPVLAEPMLGACLAARRLFGLPTSAAWSQALPFGDATFDAVWLLGVLCTVEDKPAVLRELHRVCDRGGRLGLLVLVQVTDELVDPPVGNHFPTRLSLHSDLTDAGFVIDAETSTAELAGTDDEWARKTEAVDRLLEARHGSDPGYRQANKQEQRMSRLLKSEQLETRLVVAQAR